MDLNGEYWTTEELKDQGVSEYQIKRALKAGTLHRLAHGIYMREEPGGWALLRALHHRYPELVFRGHTAVSIYGHRDTVMQPVLGLVPKGQRRPGTERVSVGRPRTINGAEFQGLPVVTPTEAIAEDSMLHRVGRLKFLEQLYSGFDGRERFERDHAQLTQDLQDALAPLLGKCVVGASSQMERFFHLELRARGIESIPNFRLGPYTWDVGVEKSTTVIDLDSLLFHGKENSRTFIIDRWKANHAEMMGWGHLRFTDACLRDPVAKRKAIEEIEHLLEHRAATGPGQAVAGRVEVGAWEVHDHLRNVT
ncbi:type IV toxin-antitoxin system AbiEi family antitoxin domain-containing protein [Corynebacterium nasicanis]|uniref:Type IV toxin-antitoxin system AbiEi family antitoxin domain-containing protein n=1 Tax=Corynebacterium nasicanis TaxID=1448267 RepID=A0ABW1QD89_9CORY